MDNNVFECRIFQAIKNIWKQNRRPDINAIFKNITRTKTTIIVVEDVKQQVDLLIASARLKDMLILDLDSFFSIRLFLYKTPPHYKQIWP